MIHLVDGDGTREAETRRIIATIREEIDEINRSGAPSLRLAILYGSVARNAQRADSDVDLAVAATSRRETAYETLTDLTSRCSSRIGREVQVRDLARADGLFLKEVLLGGVVVFQSDPTVRGELIARMLAYVEDFEPIVRRIRRANRERFLAGS